MRAAFHRLCYTLLAPWYDLFVEAATRPARRESLSRLDPAGDGEVLLCGAGSGLDIPHLPPGTRATAVDLTPAMVRRARKRAASVGRRVSLVVGDATALPFADASFDAVVLHLILAVVPEPGRVLAEAARVTRPGGRLLVLDKFLLPGERAPLRRLANAFLAPCFTRLDVVFEETLAAAPGLRVVDDRPALLGGWFRFITLERPAGR